MTNISDAINAGVVASKPHAPMGWNSRSELACLIKLIGDEQARAGERVGVSVDALHAAWVAYETARSERFGTPPRSTSRASVYARASEFARIEGGGTSPYAFVKTEYVTEGGRLPCRRVVFVPDLDGRHWDRLLEQFYKVND